MPTLTCHNGLHTATHDIFSSKIWFTVWSTPLIPMGFSRYVMVCERCGKPTRISKSDALAGAARRAPAQQPPAHAGTDAPLPSSAGAVRQSGTAAAAGPGWFRDPRGGSGLAWWDGSRWTGDTHHGE